MINDSMDNVGIELYSRWKECKLGDFIETINGFAFKSTDFLDSEEPNSLPIIKIKNVANGDVNIDGVHYHFYSDNLKKYVVEKGNILISLTGNHPELETQVVGLVSKYKLETKALLNQRVGKLFSKNPLKLNDDYLYYYLKNKDTHQYLASQSSGSANQANISKTDIEKISFSKPPIKEQTAIASILTSLDDKIDLLHRQNKTLEELAGTLFRSYFQMTNEENKYIELGNYVEGINGVSYKSSELNTSKVGMVSLKSFDRNGGFSIDGFKEFTGKFKEKQVVVEGDLIVAHTDITQEAEVIGNPALVISNPNFETMTISMDIVKVISKVDSISIEFLYFLMRTREFKSHCEGCANGSTVLHLSKQAIPTFEFPEPDKTNVAEFTKQAKEIVNKIFLNHRQLRNLVKTRDTLLPKLMSGEVRVNL